jgi:hypothetical protein
MPSRKFGLSKRRTPCCVFYINQINAWTSGKLDEPLGDEEMRIEGRPVERSGLRTILCGK